MRTSELEMSQFEQRSNNKFYQILGKTAAFEKMQQVYGKVTLFHSVLFGGTTVFSKEETVWKIICVLVDHKQNLTQDPRSCNVGAG